MKPSLHNIIFVFGSNRQGRHGKGAAKVARLHHGAIYGQAEGLQGSSYAIITKELRQDYGIVTLKEIKDGVKKFLRFARKNKHLTFLVTPIGCGNAGRTPKQIGPMFYGHPKNVIVPKEFRKYTRTPEERFIIAWKKKYPNLPEPKREFVFHEERNWRFDFAWPEKKLAVEIQGGGFIQGRHNRGFHQAKDFEKQREAARMGWVVLPFGTMDVGVAGSGKIFSVIEYVSIVLTNAVEVE